MVIRMFNFSISSLPEIVYAVFQALSPNKEKKMEEFENAFKEFNASPGCSVTKLRLERSFFKVYKKKASSSLIVKMADSQYGPYEAFDIYSRSSMNVKCDFFQGSLIVRSNAHFLERKKFLNSVVSLLGGLFAFSASGAALFLSVLIFFLLLKMVFLVEGSFFQMIEVEELAKFVGFSIYCVLLLIVFFFFAYLGIKLMEGDRTGDAIKMAENLDNS